MTLHRSVLLGLGIALLISMTSPGLTASSASGRTEAMVVVSVDCTGAPPPGAFTSIPAALATLDPNIANTVLITGDCQNQALTISHFTALTLRGAAPGATISESAVCNVPPSGPVRSVMHIVNSRGLLLDGLTIRGGGIGIDLTDSYGVSLRSVTVELSRGPGIAAGEGSSVTLVGFAGGMPTPNVIQNNCGPGVTTEMSSVVSINGGNLTIQQNGMGVQMFGGRALLQGGNTNPVLIQNNRGTGVRNFGSGILVTNQHTIIQGNGGGGIWAATGATVDAGGGIQVIGNTGIGIEAQLNSNVLFGPIVNPDATTNVSIKNNTGVGLRVAFMSLAQSFTGVAMVGNGGDDATCDGSSYIFGVTTGITKLDCKNTDKKNK